MKPASRFAALAGVAAIFVTMALVTAYFVGAGGPPDSGKTDPICRVVRDKLGLRCVRIYGDEALMGGGAYVKAPDRDDADQPVPSPNGHLLGQTCRVPGAPQQDGGIETKREDTAIESVNYSLDRSLKEGADLGFTTAERMSFKAGPAISDARTMKLTVKKSQLVTIDENSMIMAYRSCWIRLSCVQHIRDAHYKVISKELVGHDLTYLLTDASGHALDLDAGAKKGSVQVDANGRTDVHREEDHSLITEGPVVLGVDFFPPDVFADKPYCTSQVEYSATGGAHVEVGTAGGPAVPASAFAPLGRPARLESVGREALVPGCGSEPSRAFAEGQVSSPMPNAISFSQQVLVHGGFESSRIGFPFVLGCATTPTVTTAFVDMTGKLDVTIRIDHASAFVVRYDNLPSGSTLEVAAPPGALVSVPGSRAAALVQIAGISGSGSKLIEVGDAGVYSVKWTARVGGTVGPDHPTVIASHGGFSVNLPDEGFYGTVVGYRGNGGND
jgi:hypothetical protein